MAMQQCVMIAPLLLLAAVVVVQPCQAVDATANPVRKVVTMLEKIKAKVEAEGEKEEQMFKKFMCYCSNSGGDLKKGIDASTAKVPELQTSIEGAESQKTQLEADLTKHRADREAAKANMADATAIRGKDSATFAALKTEADANIAAIKSAVSSLEKGMTGSFLQTQAAATLRSLVQAQDMSDVSRQDLSDFLSANSDYSPQSGEITGILKQLGETMEKDLADATATEEAAIKDYDGLMAAKKKEVEALTVAIEEKTIRVGETAVSIANMKNDLTDTEAALIEDKKFLGDLAQTCKLKQAEWDSIVKTRAEELTALAETISLLNDDDALELFKKTLPSASAASFVQMKVRTGASAKARALALLSAAQRSATEGARPGLDFITLALRGKKVGFAKVIAMIDNMKKVLQSEQADDDNKLEYCKIQLDSLDDKRKAAERSISDSEKAVEDVAEAIDTLGSEIEALEDGIKALDKSVAEANEVRKGEHEDFVELTTQNNAAVELIGMAKNRLQKFYNPKLYVPPPKRELSAEDRIVVNNGGTAPPTPAPGGIAGTGITALVQVSTHMQTVTAPPAAPEAPGAFKKKGEESSGVIAMMDLLINDLTKETTVAGQEEKDSQADYEQMLTDSAHKRAADSQSLEEKGTAKADAEEAHQTHKESKVASTKELMATQHVIQATHMECDWLMQYYSMRKEARSDEIDSLTKAKAVLSGADFSLLQTRSLRGRA